MHDRRSDQAGGIDRLEALADPPNNLRPSFLTQEVDFTYRVGNESLRQEGVG